VETGVELFGGRPDECVPRWSRGGFETVVTNRIRALLAPSELQFPSQLPGIGLSLSVR
jgi:hypothetical protein